MSYTMNSLNESAQFEVSSQRLIGGDNPCFVIAECGQNHQGDVNIAMQMIQKVAHDIEADCVKFQKSNLQKKFNCTALERPYVSQHSWGASYGQHKTHLEFTEEQFYSLKRYAENEGIMFSSSAMDSNSLEFLVQIDVPFIKIGSADANNYPLLKLAASKNKPLIVSTGMQNFEIVNCAYNLITKINSKLSLLHCVSSYPADFQDINLKVLKQYQLSFPSAVIGYSGHELGCEVSVAAVALGAKVLERHFTLDKTMKGTDHSASLDVYEFKSLLSQIRNLELALQGDGVKKRCKSEWNCFKKLGKSIVAAKNLEKGLILQEDCIDIKVAEPIGIEAHHFYDIIGKRLKYDVSYDQSIQYDDIQDQHLE